MKTSIYDILDDKTPCSPLDGLVFFDENVFGIDKGLTGFDENVYGTELGRNCLNPRGRT